MKSNNFSKAVWTMAIFCPIFVSCQSRGESGMRRADASGFGPGDVQNTQEPAQVDDFSTRRPGTKRPIAPTRKPPIFDSRFDNRDKITKTLSFNPQLSSNMEAFALELTFQFCTTIENGNFMISPFSIYNMLVLLAEGANANTYEQINQKLKLIDLPKTRDFQQYLNVALNQSSADVTLKKFVLMVTDNKRPVNIEYENRIEKLYEAEVMPVDFLDARSTLQKINGYVSGQTQGLITNPVEIDDLYKAQLILISGLFFKGRWMNVFNQTFTKVEPFYDTNYKPTGNVNMMFQRGPFAYSPVQELGCHILELPYALNNEGGSSLSMILVLPRKGLSIESAMNNVYQFGMEKMYKEFAISKAEYEDDEVEVHIPRFDIETSLNLKETLENMGISDVFDQNQADLSNINNRYFVSSMVHKTKISVDEQGTSAAAVTTSIFANKATPPKFHANKPFLFFIVDKITKLILFSGQYVAPSVY